MGVGDVNGLPFVFALRWSWDRKYWPRVADITLHNPPTARHARLQLSSITGAGMSSYVIPTDGLSNCIGSK